MTVEQLIEALSALPPDLEVRTSTELTLVIGARLSRFLPNPPARRSKEIVCIDTEVNQCEP
jgi:hypothetical protein